MTGPAPRELASFTPAGGWVDFLVLEPGGGLYETRDPFIPLLRR